MVSKPLLASSPQSGPQSPGLEHFYFETIEKCKCKCGLITQQTWQKRVYPYPLDAGSARPNPNKGAPETEKPLFIGFTALRGGLGPWSQTMVSEGARPWGRGRSEFAESPWSSKLFQKIVAEEYYRERPPGLILHVLTVLVLGSWVLLLSQLLPSSRSLRLFPRPSVLLHGPLDICLDLLAAAPLPPVQRQDAQHMFLQHRGAQAEYYRCILKYYPINSNTILWGHFKITPLKMNFDEIWWRHFSPETPGRSFST